MDKLGCGYAYCMVLPCLTLKQAKEITTGLYNHDNDAPTTTQLGDYGDGWAGEDFSFVFKEHETSEKLGTRCLDALVVRPFSMIGRTQLMHTTPGSDLHQDSLLDVMQPGLGTCTL